MKLTVYYVHTNMSNLTAEQLKQIARNRELALLKRRQAESGLKNGTTSNVSSIQNACVRDSDVKKKFLFPNSKTITSTTETPNVSAICRLFSSSQFIVDMPFHSASIELFKTIPGKLYDANLKRWIFPLSSYDILFTKLQKLAVVNGLPRGILNAFKTPDEDLNSIDLSKIDKVLLDSILPFQEDGIRFGISKNGRCLIADDMGLGKTIQALGIAHYYKENWPLLILCPSSMKFPWEEAIQVHLPSVNAYFITVMTSSRDVICDASVVICSYDLTKTCLSELSRKKFGVIIMDESHSLKSLKAVRTKSALQLAKKCKNVILLSGTPVLSRPIELYPQIIAIDPITFLSLHEFGIRYCAGRKDKFGWNFSGSSNMEELELYLKKKLMIRRLKSEVITQLPSKIRKVIFLNPDIVQTVFKRMKKLAVDLTNKKGNEMRETLIMFYSMTAAAKADAVCKYIGEKLENPGKMLVFAHHSVMMNSLCQMLDSKHVEYIKIDGSTSSDQRKVSCDRFQNRDECRVAVLSLRAANAGITLTAACLVIFAELYWNPGELTQAEGRAHRIGQRDSVVVEYLVAKGTADEHIWGLIQSKLNVLNKVGLSKENFKEVDAKHLTKDNQATITSMFQTLASKTNDIVISDFEDDVFNENLSYGMEDDDLFQNIQLDEIENQYNIGNKKIKTDISEEI